MGILTVFFFVMIFSAGVDRCFDYAADIGFIMDSSRSVNEEDFERQKEFIIGVIRNFQISVNEVCACLGSSVLQ